MKSSIAVKIYFVGVVQVITIILSGLLFLEFNKPDFHTEEWGKVKLLTEIEREAHKPNPNWTLEQFKKIKYPGTFAVRNPEGKVLLTTVPRYEIPCDELIADRVDEIKPPEGFKFFGPPPPPPPKCLTLALKFPNKKLGSVEFRAAWRKPPPTGFPLFFAIMLIVGLSSWFVSRSITKPLKKLLQTAKDFGNGFLDARANIEREDELGDVSDAFDAMAQQINLLLKAERELIANVSHELRTPLARIRVALEIAETEEMDLVRESLTDISEDLTELEDLLSDVLTVARLEMSQSLPGGIPKLKHERIDLDEMLVSLAEKFQFRYPKRQLVVKCETGLNISGDRVLLRRTIENLLENAHKYSPPDGLISLVSHVKDQRPVIVVQDRGIGISEEDLEHIFMPFFRVNRSRTKASGGIGLGLTLAKRIIEAHDGHIRIQSKLDVGTKMIITL